MSVARQVLVRAMLLLAFHEVALAQGAHGALSGVVRRADTAIPIAGAIVEVDSAIRQETDADGQFRFAQILPGNHHVSVRQLGYEPLTVALVVGDTGDVRRDFELRPMTPVLERVVIRGREVVVPKALEEAYKRAADGGGSYFFKEDIDQLQPADLKSLFARLPGVRVNDRSIFFQRCQSLLIGSAFGADKTPPKVQVWVDGFKVTAVSYASAGGPSSAESLADILGRIPPSSVQLIEVYTGVARLPAEYLDDACAVILIWTKRF